MFYRSGQGLVKYGSYIQIVRTRRKYMMRFDLHVQRQIIWLGLDDPSPNSMFSNLHGGEHGATPAEWRKSVVLFTCAMLEAGLIYPLPEIENYEGKGTDYIISLLEHGDPKNCFDMDLIWHVMHFFGTEKLLELLRKLELNEWKALDADLSTPLGKALADLNVVQI